MNNRNTFGRNARNMKKIPVRRIVEKQKTLGPAERFSIRSVGDLVGEADLIQELHRHDFFFFLALQNGAGTHEIDFKTYKIQNNAVFFMRPGQVHQLELKTGSTGFIIEFNTEFYRPDNKLSNLRLQKVSSKNYCSVDNAGSQKLHAILHSIFREYTEKQEGYGEAIKANLNILFIELARQSRDPKSGPKETDQYAQARLEEFQALLETNITSLKQASQYANLLNLSLYQLNGITKATVGKTSSELINDYIVLEAKRYLLATPNQVKEIADHLGYEDISYFTRFFKKHTGHAPEAFRHNFR